MPGALGTLLAPTCGQGRATNETPGLLEPAPLLPRADYWQATGASPARVSYAAPQARAFPRPPSSRTQPPCPLNTRLPLRVGPNNPLTTILTPGQQRRHRLCEPEARRRAHRLGMQNRVFDPTQERFRSLPLFRLVLQSAAGLQNRRRTCHKRDGERCASGRCRRAAAARSTQGPVPRCFPRACARAPDRPRFAWTRLSTAVWLRASCQAVFVDRETPHVVGCGSLAVSRARARLEGRKPPTATLARVCPCARATRAFAGPPTTPLPRAIAVAHASGVLAPFKSTCTWAAHVARGLRRACGRPSLPLPELLARILRLRHRPQAMLACM